MEELNNKGSNSNLTSSSTSVQTPVKGIIFDLDGTLIRSVVDFPKMKQRLIEYITSQAICEVDYTPQQTTNEIILDFNQKMIENGHGEEQRIKILEEISEILTEVEFENISKVKVLPGVREFFLEHRLDGIKMGILTRASEKYTMKSLELTNLKQNFTTIATRDEFTLLRAKPHPVALEFVINKLALPAENVVFVGDHKLDFDCAAAGRIRFVGVLSGAYNRAMLNALGCEMLVEDFFELSELIKKINGKNM